jgi:hypothetical protein
LGDSHGELRTDDGNKSKTNYLNGRDLSKKGNLKRQVEYASHTAQTVFEEYSNSDELHILAASCVRWGDVILTMRRGPF